MTEVRYNMPGVVDENGDLILYVGFLDPPAGAINIETRTISEPSTVVLDATPRAWNEPRM